MKRVIISILAVMLTISIILPAHASSSLDDVLNDNQPTTSSESRSSEPSGNFMNDLVAAGRVTTTSDKMTDNINQVVKKVASVIVQVVAYFTIAFLAVRVSLDMAYIGLPFMRNYLGNGHAGTAQPQGGPGMGGPGMAGHIGGGFGGGGFGGGMMGGGMMGGGMGQQQQAQSGKIQLVSTAALNAVAAESSGGGSPFKLYIKDMLVVFIMIPILITLAATGILTNFGFLLGDLLVEAIGSFGEIL